MTNAWSSPENGDAITHKPGALPGSTLIDFATSDVRTAIQAMAPRVNGSEGIPALDLQMGSNEKSWHNQDGSTVTVDSKNEVVQVDYKNGTHRQFGWTDGQLTSVTDTDGKTYTKDANGHWQRPDGTDTGNADATVTSNGTYAFLDAQGKYDVYHTDGSHDSVSLPKDVMPYPDAAHSAQEQQRIADYLNQHPPNSDGQKVMADAAALGVSNLDLWHGVYNESQGTQLYDYFRQQFPDAQQRTSSHGPITYQVATGPYNANFVFGLTKDGNTFFQMEKDGDVNLSGDNGNGVGNGIAQIASNASGWANFTDSFLTTHHDQDANLSKHIGEGLGPLGLADRSNKVDPGKVDQLIASAAS